MSQNPLMNVTHHTVWVQNVKVYTGSSLTTTRIVFTDWGKEDRIFLKIKKKGKKRKKSFEYN